MQSTVYYYYYSDNTYQCGEPYPARPLFIENGFCTIQTLMLHEAVYTNVLYRVKYIAHIMKYH